VNTSTATIHRSVFHFNYASDDGGALYSDLSKVVYHGSTLISNYASSGAAVAHQFSDIAITNTYILARDDSSTQIESVASVSVSLVCSSSCPVGTYGQCEAVGSCYSCSIGECHKCPSGTYSSSTGAVSISFCLPCEKGTFSNALGALNCTTCQKGYYASAKEDDTDGIGATSRAKFCVPCPAGKHQLENSSYYCEECDVGSFSAEGSKKCTSCAPGKYAGSKGRADECADCPEGKFSRNSNATACDRCQSSKSSKSGDTWCAYCEEGYYRKGTICKECPENAECPRGTTVQSIEIDEAYWRVDTESIDILPCTVDASAWSPCKGGNVSSGYCEPHSHGPYCSVCNREYYKTSPAESCKSCNGTGRFTFDTRSYVLLGIVSLIGFALLWWMRLKYKGVSGQQFIDMRNTYGLFKTKLKISATFAQVATSFPAQFGVVYPQMFRNICEQLAFIFSFKIYPSIPTSCLYGTEEHQYLYRLLFETLAPLMVICLGFLYYVTKRCLFSRNDKDRIDQLNEFSMFWFLLFTYLIYPLCSTVVLTVFHCDSITPEEKYMYADYTTSCNSKVYRTMVFYALIFVFIYPLGCPFMYFSLMWYRRSKINPILPTTGKRARMTESPSDVELAVTLRLEWHELAPLTFLFDSYEPGFWWWEILVCAERLLLTNANIYLMAQPVLQPFVVLVIALVSVKLYSLLDPYILDSDDLFAEIKEWATVAMVIFTLIFQIHEASGDRIPTSISIMLITTLLSVFGIFAYFCLATIATEVSYFQSVALHLLPKNTERIKRLCYSRRAGARRKSLTTDEGVSSRTSAEEERSTEQGHLNGISIEMAIAQSI